MPDKSTLSLQQCYAFDGLNDEDLERFIGICHSVKLNPQDYFYRENDPPEYAYLVQEGEWMTELNCTDGSRQVSVFGGVGELLGFGTMDTYVYSVKALTCIQALKVTQRNFREFANDYPSIHGSLRKRGNEIMMGMYRQAAVNGKLRAHERLCVLLEHISSFQKSDSTARLNMTRQDIADCLGLNTDSVSRAFKKLEANGIINMDESGRQIDFLQRQIIQQLAARV